MYITHTYTSPYYTAVYTRAGHTINITSLLYTCPAYTILLITQREECPWLTYTFPTNILVPLTVLPLDLRLRPGSALGPTLGQTPLLQVGPLAVAGSGAYGMLPLLGLGPAAPIEACAPYCSVQFTLHISCSAKLGRGCFHQSTAFKPQR